jgi:5-methyltetrahydropteroyltriglutamate--homocysteine methyltransferase
MQRSSERILTTHVGSLVRTQPIVEGMKAKTIGAPYDEEKLEADIRIGVAQVVRKQVDVGIDIPSDGEYGRTGFRGYVNSRLAGLAHRPYDPGEDGWFSVPAEELEQFPDFFAQYVSHYRSLWMYPDVSLEGVPNVRNTDPFRVTGPITYAGQAVIGREIDNFQHALEGLNVVDAFIPADVPVARRGDHDALEFYPSETAYLYAVADALTEEYRAVVDAGFLLQIDLAPLKPDRRGMLTDKPDMTDEDVNRGIEQGIEIINHALRDIPEERIRYHQCWGSNNNPHTSDIPLRNFVHFILKIKAQAYSIEAANPRHEHEWMLWKDVKLPDGKILIPGVISHQTNVVEHPELVAWRIKNFASLVGKENVIAGTDCGFSQFWDHMRVHPSVQWAKLQALAEGARLASRDLWKA